MEPMRNFETLPELLDAVVDQFRNPAAFNWIYLNHWERLSTERFVEQVRRTALGLYALGVRPGEGVGIIAHPSPQWLVMDLAIMVNRAITVPMFPNISSENFDFEVADANVKTLFIESEEELDDPIRARLNQFDRIISISLQTQGNKVTYGQNLLHMGDALAGQNPTMYRKLCSEILPSDIATIIYTSGSTGVPKGVELTHKNFVAQIHGAAQRFPVDPSVDCALSCLPLAHVFERMVIYYFLSTGMRIYFADDIKKVGERMKEIRPTIMTVVPRILEKVFDKMNHKADTEKGLKKHILNAALRHARAHEPEDYSVLGLMYHKLVYSKMREALGGRIKYLISGGAPLQASINRFFWNIGVPIYEGYGLTEAAPVLAANHPGAHRIGTVGPAFPEVELKLGENNELLARGPNIMKAYHKNTSATNQSIDAEGWLHTGDQAEISADGFVTITGRIKELFKTSGGKFVSPVPLEQKLTRHRLIEHAVVVAEGKSFVSCLLFPDFEKMEEHKKYYNLSALTNTEFLKHPDVQDSLKRYIDKLNKDLNHWEQIHGFKLIPETLLIEDGMLTPKMNVRRNAVYKKYAAEIEKFYHAAD